MEGSIRRLFEASSNKRLFLNSSTIHTQPHKTYAPDHKELHPQKSRQNISIKLGHQLGGMRHDGRCKVW